jgi:hypothetical protein
MVKFNAMCKSMVQELLKIFNDKINFTPKKAQILHPKSDIKMVATDDG